MVDYPELKIRAAALAGFLGGGKEIQLGDGKWQTRCPGPVHRRGDENPSLLIFVDQNIRFQCMAGCEDEDIRSAIAERGFVIPELTRASGAAGLIVNKTTHEERPTDEWFMGSAHLAFNQRVPDHLYTYRHSNGQVAFIMARLDADPPHTPKKIVRPVVSVRARDGHVDFWSSQGYPHVQPLYNLLELVARPDAPVLLVEGEKTAEAARLLCPDYVVTTWAFGAGAASKAGNKKPNKQQNVNWGSLAGRDVVIWPDNDEAGMKAMQMVVKLLAKGQKAAKSLKRVLDTVDPTFPEGFDLADDYSIDLTPLHYMLEHAGPVDSAKLPDVPLPADDEEIKSRVDAYLEKYAPVMLSNGEHRYVDLQSRSPLVVSMIPYVWYSRNSLESREAEAYTAFTVQGGARRVRFIDRFIESDRRNWHEGIIYDPSSTERSIKRDDRQLLNLYAGMANAPSACDPKLYQCFIDHIHASCTEAEANYILDWFAAKFQHPEEMLGTMIVLSGRQGCGKTIICDIVARILGPHNSVKVPMSALPGSFNSQYSNKLLINVEEYDPGASKEQRDLREMVKNLITSTTMLVNEKGTPAYQNPAYHSIIATTNSQTPEGINFDNRRMTFIRFENPNLKLIGSVIDDEEYFAPLVELTKYPLSKALSGLCHYFMKRKISLGRVKKPLSTRMSKEAKTFVDSPVHEFLRTLAEEAAIPQADELPDNENLFPISQWPRVACAIPRCVLNKMLRQHAHGRLTALQAGKLLGLTLPDRVAGIPESHKTSKEMRWNMVNRAGQKFEQKDRSFFLPNLVELRVLVEKAAGEPIDWSEFEAENARSDDKVVDLKGKRVAPDIEQF